MFAPPSELVAKGSEAGQLDLVARSPRTTRSSGRADGRGRREARRSRPTTGPHCVVIPWILGGLPINLAASAPLYCRKAPAFCPCPPASGRGRLCSRMGCPCRVSPWPASLTAMSRCLHGDPRARRRYGGSAYSMHTCHPSPGDYTRMQSTAFTTQMHSSVTSRTVGTGRLEQAAAFSLAGSVAAGGEKPPVGRRGFSFPFGRGKSRVRLPSIHVGKANPSLFRCLAETGGIELAPGHDRPGEGRPFTGSVNQYRSGPRAKLAHLATA